MVFVSSYGFNRTSAGIKLQHRLCHLLNESGVNACMTTPAVNPEWKTPHADPATGDKENDIIVLNERDRGNSHGFKRVIRWCLNRPGWMGEDREFSNAEYIVPYNEYCRNGFHECNRLHDHPIFQLSITEPWLFNDIGTGERPISCLWTYKGQAVRDKFKIEIEDGPGLIEITTSYPTSREALAELLRRTRTLYSYDHYSALNTEAILCGADVQIIGADGALRPYQPEPPELDNFRNNYDNIPYIRAMFDRACKWFNIQGLWHDGPPSYWRRG